MNFANYSPYNKSYRFICFQNQAYHEKNKTNASPCVKTNIRYLMNRSSDNPETFTQRRSQSSHRFSRSYNSDLTSSEKFSNSMIRSVSLGNALISQEKRVVHKNESFEKFRLKKVSHQNIEMVNRLLEAQCQVVKKKHTERSFQNHLKYREIRKKYNDQGLRKTKMCLGNSQLLCPTLLDYNRSGMAQKFVQMDLSMSMVPSTASSRMRKRRSDNECMHQSQNDL